MAIEQIKMIREAERQADEIRRQSNLKSKQLVDTARKDAAALLADAHRSTEAAYRDMLAAADRESQASYDRVIRETEKECEKISAEADKNLDKGVSIIMERL